MPLLDHFHPPLSVQHPWEGFHGAWANAQLIQRNRDLLPPDYWTVLLVTVGVSARTVSVLSPVRADNRGQD